MNLPLIKSFNRNLLFLVCLLPFVELKAQLIKSNMLVIGVVDSIQSKILGENRRIWVYVPESARDTNQVKGRYPVVYLLDGEAHFSSVSGMIQQLSEVNGNTVCPEMIVIGISNTHRSLDFTPTKDTMVGFPSGGGEKFTEFIEKELMPHIDSNYPVAPYKMLIGHSFGGLEVINTLVNHPALFNAYVAIDPSVWWDSTKLLQQAQTVLTKESYKGKSLFLGIANTMPQGMDTVKVRKDNSELTEHIRAILTLKDLLKSSEVTNGLHFDYKYYKDENHHMVPLITAYDALHFLFSFYSLPLELDIRLYDTALHFNGPAFIEAHYKNVSRQMGYQILPAEGQIIQYGMNFLRNKMPKEAFAFFSMNDRNYPHSGKTYSSIGDFYNSLKNREEAIRNFKKSLSIEDSKETRVELSKLMADK